MAETEYAQIFAPPPPEPSRSPSFYDSPEHRESEDAKLMF
jgi:hypothetical protein